MLGLTRVFFVSEFLNVLSQIPDIGPYKYTFCSTHHLQDLAFSISNENRTKMRAQLCNRGSSTRTNCLKCAAMRFDVRPQKSLFAPSDLVDQNQKLVKLSISSKCAFEPVRRALDLLTTQNRRLTVRSAFVIKYECFGCF